MENKRNMAEEMGREQSFVARYSFDVPHVGSAVEKPTATYFYVRNPAGEEFFVTSSEYSTDKGLVAELRRCGVELVERVKDATRDVRRVVDPKWESGVDGFNATNSVEDGEVRLHREYGWCHVRTPSRLGTREHMRRRGLVERFLRAHGVTFTLDCATEHSALVCRPVLMASEAI